MKKLTIIVTFIAIVACLISMEKNVPQAVRKGTPKTKPLITFVELGSTNCIPCKQMQPVMQGIEQTYGNKVQVIFYDVWQPKDKEMATKYGIKLIPTQVFLDKDGKEFFRHEGFFPQKDIEKLIDAKLANKK